MTLAFFERLDDEQARVEEAVDAVGLNGGSVSGLETVIPEEQRQPTDEACLFSSTEASSGSALDAAACESESAQEGFRDRANGKLAGPSTCR